MLAQKKTPKLPDFSKLTAQEQDGHIGDYYNKEVIVLHKHYEYFDADDDVHYDVEVFYKPLPLSLFNDLDVINRSEFVRLSKNGGVLFILHLAGSYENVYAKTRKWYEFYRLWFSSLRKIEGWRSLKSGSDEDRFFKENFGLILSGSLIYLSN